VAAPSWQWERTDDKQTHAHDDRRQAFPCRWCFLRRPPVRRPASSTTVSPSWLVNAPRRGGQAGGWAECPAPSRTQHRARACRPRPQPDGLGAPAPPIRPRTVCRSEKRSPGAARPPRARSSPLPSLQRWPHCYTGRSWSGASCWTPVARERSGAPLRPPRGFPTASARGGLVLCDGGPYGSSGRPQAR